MDEFVYTFYLVVNKANFQFDDLLFIALVFFLIDLNVCTLFNLQQSFDFNFLRTMNWWNNSRVWPIFNIIFINGAFIGELLLNWWYIAKLDEETE